MLKFFNKSVRYWNTIRYLKLIQILARVQLFLPNLKISQDNKNKIRLLPELWVKPAQRNQSMIDKNTFNFLNEIHKISLDDWNNNEFSKLWLYNLHYFDDLNAHENQSRNNWHIDLINSWVNANASMKGNGWEPYPLSIRIVNWIKWSLNGKFMEASWANSLEIQARALSQNIEKHLLGNHIFANAKALIFAGLFFKGNEAKKWYEKGQKIIARELDEQVLSDGGNFELSPMYHLIFLEDLLDLINIHQAYNLELQFDIEKKVFLMFKWLKIMCHPDGEISFFNDSAIGSTPSVKQIEDYAIRLKLFKSPSDFHHNAYLTNLDNSGYTRVSYKDIVAIIDRSAIGPNYLPAHAHADTLSFEMSLFGNRVIVNSGTSVYGASLERQIQRGTQSHSTVMLNGKNSSEVWGGFRVARRAKVFDSKDNEQDDKIILSASHNGYCRLKGKPVHNRKWEFSNQLLVVEDKIEGKLIHDVNVIFHLHPKVEINEVNSDRVVLNIANKKIQFNFEGNGLLKLEKSLYHPGFGMSNDNYKILYQLSGNLPLKVITRISW